MKISETLKNIQCKADQLDAVLYDGAFFVLWYGCDCSISGQEDLDWHIGLCEQDGCNIQFSDIELYFAEDKKLSRAIQKLENKIDEALASEIFKNDEVPDVSNVISCNNKILDIDGKKFKLTLTPID